MRSSSYCTAASYKIKDLTEYLISNGSEPQIFDNVIHIQKENRDLESRHIDIFYFLFGTVVIWGAEKYQEKLILEELHNFEIEPVEHIASDFMYFRYIESIDKTYIDEETNEIILNDHSVFTKFSMSNAFAQSSKLSILEQSVSKLLSQASPIQEELAKTGTISLSKKQISKQIGVLFSERYSINLHSDILDTPEFFWRRPSYEPLYLMTAKFQDIQLRQNVLNHRLDVVHELYSLLSNELNYKHSTRLEWVIILLIAIEVLIGLSKWF